MILRSCWPIAWACEGVQRSEGPSWFMVVNRVELDGVTLPSLPLVLPGGRGMEEGEEAEGS